MIMLIRFWFLNSAPRTWEPTSPTLATTFSLQTLSPWSSAFSWLFSSFSKIFFVISSPSSPLSPSSVSYIWIYPQPSSSPTFSSWSLYLRCWFLSPFLPSSTLDFSEQSRFFLCFSIGNECKCSHQGSFLMLLNWEWISHPLYQTEMFLFVSNHVETDENVALFFELLFRLFPQCQIKRDQSHFTFISKWIAEFFEPGCNTLWS